MNMIDTTTQRRQLRDEIARLRRRIDRRVAPLVQSGRFVGGFVARRRAPVGWTFGLLAVVAAVGCFVGRCVRDNQSANSNER
jgi:hypothetical protein